VNFEFIHDISTGLIIAAYLVFAWQMFKQISWSEIGKGGKAVALLTAVFVLCAMTGYLTDLILLPQWLDVMLHVALAGASIWLIATNQAQFIARMIKNEHH